MEERRVLAREDIRPGGAYVVITTRKMLSSNRLPRVFVARRWRGQSHGRVICSLALLLCVVLTDASRGQNSADSRATLAEIPGVIVYVDTLSPDMPQKGMTRSAIKLNVEKRL